MKETELQKGDETAKAILVNLHKSLLEALRRREEEVLRYIALLVSPLTGFIWLLRRDLNDCTNCRVFLVGTSGVILLLLVGAIYSLALGYSFRSMRFQLLKLEKCFGIRCYLLKPWTMTKKPCKLWKQWLYVLPEIMKVFWLAFVITIIGVTVFSAYFYPSCWGKLVLGVLGAISLASLLFAHIIFWSKIHRLWPEEMDSYQ